MADVSFHYRAATLDGRLVEGTVTASSKEGVIDQLRRSSLYAVDVVRTKNPSRPAARRRFTRPLAVANFARTLASITAAGVPVERALDFVTRQSSSPAVAEAAASARQQLHNGATLTEAFRSHEQLLGSVFVEMVAAGDESGMLDETMARLADELEQGVEMRSQMRAALLYPAFVALATMISVTVLVVFVVPRFADMLNEQQAQLPLSTHVVLIVSQLMLYSLWIMIPLGLLAVAISRQWLSDGAHRRAWHRARLRLPLLGDLEHKYVTARFARTLAILLKSGRPLVTAVASARSSVQNHAFRKSIDDAVQAVTDGSTLRDALQDVLPPLASELLSIGEETGRLDEFAERVAENYETDVRRSLRTAVGIIEPVMILLFGAIVGFIALAMLQAIYAMNSTVL